MPTIQDKDEMIAIQLAILDDQAAKGNRVAEFKASTARQLSTLTHLRMTENWRDRLLRYLNCHWDPGTKRRSTAISLTRECPKANDGKKHSPAQSRGHVFCNMRFFCVGCAETANHRLLYSPDNPVGSIDKESWLGKIKISLCCPPSEDTGIVLLGPMALIEWPILDYMDVVKGLSVRRSFNRYMEQTWPKKLADQGIEDWTMVRCFDPVRNQIRAIYLGLNPDWSTLLNTRGFNAYSR